MLTDKFKSYVRIKNRNFTKNDDQLFCIQKSTEMNLQHRFNQYFFNLFQL